MFDFTIEYNQESKNLDLNQDRTWSQNQKWWL